MSSTSSLTTTLAELLGDRSRVDDGDSNRALHARDMNHDDGVLPDVVVYPETVEEVSRVLMFAHRERMPVTPFGAGSSVEGHVIPLYGGISLDMTRMDAILEVRPGDLMVVVEPGVLREQLNHRLGGDGLQFPIDPGANASLGGMVSTNASGTTAVRYGAMRQQVLGLEVVLADGTIIHTGGTVIKTSAGYNLTSLFVGAEGTLGVITKIILRVYGIPEYVIAGRVAFPTVDAACRAVSQLIALGSTVTRCELIDEGVVRSFNRHFGSTFPETPTLFFEFGGTEASVVGEIATATELCTAEGGSELVAESTFEGRRRLWEMRHRVGEAHTANWPGRRIRATDVTVPISQLPRAVALTRKDVEQTPFPTMFLGHIGDGNYHLTMIVDPDDPDEIAEVNRIGRRQVEIALELGGTCTGEHGIGFGKMPYLLMEHGDAIPAMRAIKLALDPRGIMNPGKVFSAAPPGA